MSGEASVVIMAGGTGGHVYPGLAVAEVLRSRDVPTTWIGTRQGLEARVVPAAGIPMEWIDVGGVRGKGFATRLKSPWRIAHAVAEAVCILRRLHPTVALGMGGFASGPGGLAARGLGCPLIVHEQNAAPGMTNRVLSHLAARLLEGFPGSFAVSRHAEYMGNPVRRSIAMLPPPETRLTERTGRIRLLIIGGSQGARVLNENVPRAIAQLEDPLRPEVWHQTGARDADQVAAAYRAAGIPARVAPFIDNMAGAYGWADLALCRAGALTVAELAVAGLGALLVPFAAAVDDHQTRNAQFLVEAAAAELLSEAQLSVSSLVSALARLLQDRPRLRDMARRARGVAKPDAALNVANACLQAGRRS